MPDQLGFGSPEWETLRIQSWRYRSFAGSADRRTGAALCSCLGVSPVRNHTCAAGGSASASEPATRRMS